MTITQNEGSNSSEWLLLIGQNRAVSSDMSHTHVVYAYVYTYVYTHACTHFYTHVCRHVYAHVYTHVPSLE